MKKEDYQRFENLRFDDFRAMAGDDTLSPHEKIGFPNAYREGYEPAIFADILSKLANLRGRGKTILDIGPGVSGLPRLLMDHCEHQGHTLLLADGPEILAQLPKPPFVHHFPGRYPEDAAALFEDYTGKIDAILTYSVFHYVFDEGDPAAFVDRSLSLLAHGGELLIGDIPNISQRNRFFASPEGIACHQKFTGTDEIPEPQPTTGKIDDAFLLNLAARARQNGVDAWLLPQGGALPMANRREDFYLRRP